MATLWVTYSRVGHETTYINQITVLVGHLPIHEWFFVYVSGEIQIQI